MSQQSQPETATTRLDEDQSDERPAKVRKIGDNVDETAAAAPAEPAPTAVTAPVEMLAFQMKHASQTYNFSVEITKSLVEFKQQIFRLTEVLPHRQKIIGLFAKQKQSAAQGSSQYDDQPIRSLLPDTLPKPPLKFVLIGTPESQIMKDLSPEDLPFDVVNDLQADDDERLAKAESDAWCTQLQQSDDVQQKLTKAMQTLGDIQFISQPRPGKKLIVLDIDYTIFDCKEVTGSRSHVPMSILKRPHLETFLEAIYKDFDIAFWSQTSWRYLEAKLTELGLLFSSKYRICFILDKTIMFDVPRKVPSKRDPKRKTHQVKALQIIWNKLPHLYNAKNTVHVDDLQRNFVLNPRNGILVDPYKNADERLHAQDTELLLLTSYITEVVAPSTDVRTLELLDWKYTLAKRNQPQ